MSAKVKHEKGGAGVIRSWCTNLDLAEFNAGSSNRLVLQAAMFEGFKKTGFASTRVSDEIELGLLT